VRQKGKRAANGPKGRRMSQRGATNGRERGDELAVVEFGELPLEWKISLRTVKFLARLERERSQS
jgi:hypothetical protein